MRAFNRLPAAVRLLFLFPLLLLGRAAAGQGTPIPGSPGWEWQLPQPTGYQLVDAHFFSDSSLIAVGGHGTAVRTRDDGRHWQVLPLPATVDHDLTSVSFADSLHGWIGAEMTATSPLHYQVGPGKILRTTNGGQTWTVQNLGETESTHRPRVIAFSPTEALALLDRQGMEYLSRLQTYGRKPSVPVVRYTTNGGQTWTARPALPLTGMHTDGEGVRVKAVTFPAPNAGYVVLEDSYSASWVLRTTDRGLSWQNITPDSLGTFRAGMVQFFDPLHGVMGGYNVSGTMFVGGTKLYRTRDGGLTWTAVSSNVDNFYYVSLENASFADPARGVAGIYTTADSGRTWLTNPMPSPLALRIGPARLRPSGRGWALGYGLIARTPDYGQTWLRASGTSQLADCRRIDFPDPTHGWALPYGANIYIDYAANHFVLHTTDRGAHWQPLDLTTRTTGVAWDSSGAATSDGAFPDQDTAWVVGALGDRTGQSRAFVLRTTNGGQTWGRQTIPAVAAMGAPSNLSLEGGVKIGARDARCAILTTGRDGVLLVTRDGGQTWQQPATGTTHGLRDAIWADSATVYVRTDTTQLLKSTNAGRTWQVLPFAIDNINSNFPPPLLTFTSAQTGYFVVGDWFVRTTDGGASWQLQMRFGPVGSRDPSNYSTPDFKEILFTTPRDAFAVNRVDVFSTRDAGQTWTKQAYLNGNYFQSPVGSGRSTRIDRYNAFFTGVGLSHYSGKFIQTDTALARTRFCLDGGADSVTVAFTTEGPFAPAEQDFRVELSNRKGRFRKGETTLVGRGPASPLLARLPAGLAPGTYRLRVIRADSSVLGSDNGVDLLINQRPAAVSLTPADSVAFCAGDSAQLTAPAGYAHYQWSTGATTPAVWVRAAGTYAVQVGAAPDCLSPASDSVRVRVKAVPALPVISSAPQASGIVVLTSSAATGNQWFFNGQPLAGATGPTYVVSTGAQSGSYAVQVTQAGCPSPLSAAVPVSVTGLAAELAVAVSVSPNPARTSVAVRATGGPLVGVTLTDLLGRVVARVSSPGNETVVPLANVAAGTYLLRAELAGGVGLTRRLVVAK